MATSSLTFPRAIYAKLSPHPFLAANLSSPSTDPSLPSKRTNGRAPREARQPYVRTSSLSHAHGSAVVRTGDTTVICGIRGEILPVTNIPNFRTRTGEERKSCTTDSEKAAQELRDYDLLVPNIEMATGCAPQFLPGVPPTTLAQTLSTRVASLLHSSKVVEVKDLEIWHVPEAGAKVERGSRRNEGEMDISDEEAEEEADDATEEAQQPQLVAYWVLYIDLLFISFDGNPFDAAWAAVMAALRTLQLPAARWDADREMVLCSRKARPVSWSEFMPSRGLPIAMTAVVMTEKREQDRSAQGQAWLLVDPDRIEETLCDEQITVIVDKSRGQSRILGISKGGGVVIGPDQMQEVVKLAETRWEDWAAAMR